MQTVTARSCGGLVECELPGPRQRLADHDLAWGNAEEIGSPAYWAAQAWMWEIEEPDHYRLGRTLREETLACLLGGYGIPAEVGLAAYARLCSVPERELEDEARVLELLLDPLEIGDREIRYRFARQKARYVAAAASGLANIALDGDDRSLRDALMTLPGVGPKTASWIVRNWRGSDDVSILDIHILRAGAALGLFAKDWRVERHYSQMENAYLGFARAIGARASILDSVMWMTMRQLPSSIVLTMRDHRPSKAGYNRSGGFDMGQTRLI